MLKKAFSLLLCVVACVTCFSMTAVKTQAVYDAKTLFAVTSKTVKDDLIKYTISVSAQQEGIAGAILVVDYDSTVLKPVSCGPAKKVDSQGKTVKNFDGTFVYGVTKENKNVYSIAYMNSVVVSTGKTAEPFFNVTFKVIDNKRPKTTVKFSCKEYYSVTNPEKNIVPSDGVQAIKTYKNVVTLEAPVMSKIKPIKDGFALSWLPVTGAKGYAVYRTTSDGGKIFVGETVGADKTVIKDTGLESGVKYTYMVSAVNDFSESAMSSNGLSSTYVAKPTVTSVKNAVGGIGVYWKKTAGAKQYNIMRRTAGSTSWTKVATRSATLSAYYKDTSVKDGVQYEYDVNSVADSFVSVTASTGKKVIYVKAPTGITVANASSGVHIKWSAHSKATKYIIYKKTVGEDSGLKQYKETTKTSFVDTQVEGGKTYTYSVRTITPNGSSAYNTTGYTITRVPSTTVSSLSLNKSSVRVSWKKVSKVDGYVIYRKRPTATSWTKVATVKKDVSYYDDSGVGSGVRYFYAVSPIYNNSEGAKVSSKSVYVIKATPKVILKSEKDGIVVSWTKVGGATSYRIYRSTDGASSVLLATVKDGKVSFKDKNVKNETKYMYSIVSVSDSGTSKKSSAASIYRWEQEVKTKVALATGGIKVAWNKYSRASSYVVYRSVNGGAWTRIAKVKSANYVDKNVSSNKAYRYAVSMVVNGSEGIVYKPTKNQIIYIAPANKITTANSSGYTKISWKAVAGATKYYIYKADSKGGEFKKIGTTSKDTLSFIDKNVKAGKVAYYSVRCTNGKLTSTHSTAKRNVFLTIPKITSVVNNYTGQTISWNKVKGANEYKLYYKIYGEKKYTYITTVDSKTLSYTFKSPVNGKVMCYIVKAVNSDSVSSYLAKCMTYAQAPKVTLSNSRKGVLLEWKANKSAAGYWIYRKAPGAKYWTRIACVTKNYYTDKTAKSGTAYLYTVKVYTGKVLSGCKQDGWKIKHLSAPVVTSVVNGYGNVTCTWKAVPGAKSYEVYRKTDKDSTWRRVGTTTKVVYKDKNVTSLTKYSYIVKAISDKYVSSTSATAKSTKYLAAPVVSISNSTSGVYVQWNKVSYATSYYVYRKESGDKEWTKIDTVTSTAYLDTNVKPGAAYTYTVKAYGSKILSGCNESGWKTVFLSVPKVNSVVSNSGGVQVKWQKVSYATSYAVYRKAKGDTSWTQIGTVSGNDNLTYVDKTAKAGTTYTYTVRARYKNYISWFEQGLTCKVN